MPKSTELTGNRIQIPGKTKPLRVVANRDGQPVMEGDFYLAYHDPTSRYYVARCPYQKLRPPHSRPSSSQDERVQ